MLFVNSSIYLISFINTQKRIFQATRDRAENLTETVAGLIDRQSYSELSSRFAPAGDFGQIDGEALYLFDEKTMNEAENSVAYSKISDQLNLVRNSAEDIILYVYILIPTSNQDKARFAADADLLSDKKNGSETMVSRFSMIYDIKNFPAAKKAITEKVTVSDNVFRDDPEYDQRSLMCFSPIKDESGAMTGILGIDISDEKYESSVSDMRKTFIISAVTVIVISVFASVSVLSLAKSVYSPENKDNNG